MQNLSLEQKHTLYSFNTFDYRFFGNSNVISLPYFLVVIMEHSTKTNILDSNIKRNHSFKYSYPCKFNSITRKFFFFSFVSMDINLLLMTSAQWLQSNMILI